MKTGRLTLSLLFGLCLLLSGAPVSAAGLPVTWEARLEPGDARAGEGAQVVVAATRIEAPWHIYSLTPREGPGPRPTSVELLPGPALAAAGKPVQPEPKREFDEGFKINVEIYEGAAAFALPVKLKAGITGAQRAGVKVRYQACKGGSCMPPKTLELPLSFTVADGPARPARLQAVTTAPKQPEGYAAAGSGPPSTPAGTGAEGAGAAPAAPVQAQDVGTRIKEAQSGGLLAFIWLSISMGFLALLTPCVFPMVPITVSFFAKQQEDAPGAGISGPVAYCLGIIGTFTGLGLLVTALFGASGLHRLATNPYVNLGLAVLFVVLAVNLFGGFEIILPASLVERTQSGTQRGGFIGPLLMGLTFTLTSFTCTVAFVGTLLASTARGDWFWPVVGMLAFSTAFASPFFLLALFPQWLARLPRSGSWLVTVKGYMGFLELAAALKFLSNTDLVWRWGVLTRPVFLAVWFAVAAVAAFYLQGWLRLPHDSGGNIGLFRRGLGVATAVAGVYCLLAINGGSIGKMSAFLPPEPYPFRGGKENLAGSPRPGGVTWLQDYQAALQLARSEGKPLFLNFTGDTCTNCRDVENNVFTRSEVQEELKKFVTVELVTDRDDERSKQYQALQLRHFGQTTLPLYIVEDAAGKTLAQRDYQPPTPDSFVTFLRRASSASSGTAAAPPVVAPAASSSPAPSPASTAARGPVTWEARLEPGDARAGEGAQVVVAATRIEAPWHIYSLTPRPGPGPRPTSLELLPGPALAAAGSPVQPEPKREFDEGFKINVEVYENNATFTLPVKLAEGAVGAQRAVVKVRYQACKGGSCMPPKTLELPLSFTVADGPARSDRLQAVTSR